MAEVRAPDAVPQRQAGRIEVFLAGSIDNGRAEQWQTELVRRARDERGLTEGDVVFLNPRRADWDASWRPDESEPRFTEQVEWELDGMERADYTLFFFAPGSLAPVSMLELGLRARLPSARTLVLCDPGFARSGNVRITCRRYGLPLASSWDHVLDCIAQWVAAAKQT